MKPATSTLLVTLGLTLAACATTGHPVAAAGTETNRNIVAMNAGGSSHRDTAASSSAADAPDREPASFARAERGIPTPQPARDPGAMVTREFSVPTPQPPIPAEPRFNSFPSNAARW